SYTQQRQSPHNLPKLQQAQRMSYIYAPHESDGACIERLALTCASTVCDFNIDAFEDLFITAWPQNILYRNNGDGTFTDVTEAAGLLHPGKRWGSGCTWVDYDRDGRLDLFVSNYLVFDFDKIPPTGKEIGRAHV